MDLIRIETYEGNAVLEHFINCKYIVRMSDLPNGQSEILLESGDRYIVNQSIYKIKEKIDDAMKS